MKILICEYFFTDSNYSAFFIPEIDAFVQNEKKLMGKTTNSFDPSKYTKFDKQRQIGENHSYICNLMRNDSVEDFIVYVNKNNIPLSSTIKPSFFETNLFLSKRNPTLIEYSAFFGAIQIFQYLKYNQVNLTPSLWLYTIHSKNPELIHLLEENNVEPNVNKTYDECLKESIKCHHNDIANYFLECKSISDSEYTEKAAIRNCNFLYFPEKFENISSFFHLSKFKYTYLVNVLLNDKEYFKRKIEKI